MKALYCKGSQRPIPPPPSGATVATRATAAKSIKTKANRPNAEYVIEKTFPIPVCAFETKPLVFKLVWSVPIAYMVYWTDRAN